MKNNHQDMYKLLRDAYEGMGGFLDGSYLRKHDREAAGKYNQRRELAYYLNYFKPCVDAHVAPIFKTLAIRDYKGTGAASWEIFAGDVDFKGTQLKDLMKQAALKAKINGVSFIVMDRAEDATTLEALEENRQTIPYAFIPSQWRDFPLRFHRWSQGSVHSDISVMYALSARLLRGFS